MTISGIGNDIIEIERIEQSIEKHGQRFLDRMFTPKEQEYCLSHKNSAQHFAGRFAAKEAIAKALGTGFREGTAWCDIEILNDPLGKPIVILKNFDANVMLSISHCKNYATAMAIEYNE